jgi:ribosomal protein L23
MKNEHGSVFIRSRANKVQVKKAVKRYFSAGAPCQHVEYAGKKKRVRFREGKKSD